MYIRYHCSVCHEAYQLAATALACEAQKPVVPHEVGTKRLCFGQVVEIKEYTMTGKGHRDYLYRAIMHLEDNPGSCAGSWDETKWLHHGQLTPHHAVAA